MDVVNEGSCLLLFIAAILSGVRVHKSLITSFRNKFRAIAEIPAFMKAILNLWPFVHRSGGVMEVTLLSELRTENRHRRPFVLVFGRQLILFPLSVLLPS
jgi:hypothetical protein